VPHPREQEGQTRFGRPLVVEKEIILGDPFPQFDDFRMHPIEANAFLDVFAEHQGLAMLEIDHVVILDLLVGGIEEGVVIEDVAILIDLDKSRPFVVGGPLKDVGQMLDVDVNGTGDERRFRNRSHNTNGVTGLSIDPTGVLLVFDPTGLVGEYCPFVSP